MIRMTPCALLALSLGLPVAAGSQEPYPRIEIVRVDTEPASAYRVLVAVTSPFPLDKRFQPLVFIRDHRNNSFQIAGDEKGEAALPELAKPEKPSPDRTEWVVTFAPPAAARGRASSQPGRAARIAIYAVACLVEPRPGWNRAKDRDAFRLLPFGAAKTFDDVLSALAGFGWQPIGFTSVGD